MREVCNPKTLGPGILTLDSDTSTPNSILVVVVGIVSFCKDCLVVDLHSEGAVSIDGSETLLPGVLLAKVGDEAMSRVSVCEVVEVIEEVFAMIALVQLIDKRIRGLREFYCKSRGGKQK